MEKETKDLDIKVEEFLNEDPTSSDAKKLSVEEQKKEDLKQAIANFDEDAPIQIEGMETAEDIDSSLKFKLDQFEGPLDLLYHLVKVAKIDIRDIFISQITEQYLEMMKDIDSLDMEKAADFTLMASTLLEIKSKKLLHTERRFTSFSLCLNQGILWLRIITKFWAWIKTHHRTT